MEALEGLGSVNSYRCLHVGDIQAEIFKFLNSKDCIPLARTCRSFYEEAMNVIWADVESFIPFVRCMPVDAVVQSKVDEYRYRRWSGCDNFMVVSPTSESPSKPNDSY